MAVRMVAKSRPAPAGASSAVAAMLDAAASKGIASNAGLVRPDSFDLPIAQSAPPPRARPVPSANPSDPSTARPRLREADGHAGERVRGVRRVRLRGEHDGGGAGYEDQQCEEAGQRVEREMERCPGQTEREGQFGRGFVEPQRDQGENGPQAAETGAAKTDGLARAVSQHGACRAQHQQGCDDHRQQRQDRTVHAGRLAERSGVGRPPTSAMHSAEEVRH